MREHAPIVLSVAALGIALTGTVPVGPDASGAGKTKVIARDSAAVSGYSASRKPVAGHLLALDRHGRFPARVVPRVSGPRGPRGAQGPRGQAGTAGVRGGDLVYTLFGDDGGRAYTVNNGERRPMAQLTNLPAAKYLVIGGGWSGSVSALVSPGVPPEVGGGPAQYWCVLTHDRNDVAISTVRAGRGPGGSRMTPHLAIAGIDAGSGATLGWECASDAERDARAGDLSLLALRVGRLDSQVVGR